MSDGSDCDNTRVPPFSLRGKDGLYDNSTMNIVNPEPESVENNEMQPGNMNTEYWNRRKSLTKYRKDIYRLQRRIHSKLARQDKIEPNINDCDLRNTSQTELKMAHSVTDNGTAHAQTENEIYSTRLQEGNDNLMFVCEPKTPQKTCYKQIGNNNVMVNLHMSMVSNSCQILQKGGKIIQLDADGEIWLEVKVRRNKEGESCSKSDKMNDLNQGTESSDRKQVPCDLPHSRAPTEGSDWSTSSGSSTGSGTLCRQSAIENEWQSDSSFEMDKYSSLKDIDDQSDEENVRVYEKEDAILVQVATSTDGMRLSDYSNLAECAPVQDALKHKKVMDFLKRSNKFDFDVDVTNWEYEREPVYSIPEDFPPTPDCDEEQYSIVNPPMDTGRTYKIQRKPTVPPRPHIPGSPVVTDISDVWSTQGRATAATHTEGPILPPRLYKQPCENTDLSPPKLTLSLDESLAKLPSHGTISTEGVKSPTIPCKTPVKELPPPPSFTKRPPHPSPRMPRKNIQSMSDSPWYHGDIDNTISKSLLLGKPAGSFLVRDSSDTSGSHKYTLEFVADGSVRRLKIIQMDDKYHLKESDTTFETAVLLVEEAMKTGLEIKDSKRSSDWRMIKIIPVEKSQK